MIVKFERDHLLISTDRNLLQVERIHRFLSTEAYWCLNIPLERVQLAMQNSLCFGLYEREEEELVQIGFARIVTDYSTFAWLCDVYVEKHKRGLGLSKWLIEVLCSHPQLKGLRRFCLATKDAHKLYEQFGFKVTATPQNWMEIKSNEIYK